MDNLFNLYPFVLNNTMQPSRLEEEMEWEEFRQILKTIKFTWNQYSKDGLVAPQRQVIQNAWHRLNKNKFNFLDLFKSLVRWSGAMGYLSENYTETSQDCFIVPMQNFILEILWPNLLDKSITTNVWEILKDRANTMVGIKITENESWEITRITTTIQNSLIDLKESIQEAVHQPISYHNNLIPQINSAPYTDRGLNAHVRNQVDDTLNHFELCIYDFQKIHLKLIELPFFCLIATLHLMVLQSKAHFGIRWGFDHEIILQTIATLRMKIKEYMKYAQKLLKVEKQKCYTSIDKSNSCITFLLNECQSHISIWPYFDIIQYPYTIIEKTYVKSFSALSQLHSTAIASIDLDVEIPIIKSIPAEMGIVTGQRMEESIIGANVIKLSYGQIVELPFTNLTDSTYQIRYRVSNGTKKGQLRFEIGSWSNTVEIEGILASSHTQNAIFDTLEIQGEQGTYRTFPEIKLDKNLQYYIPNENIVDYISIGNHTLKITNVGLTDIIIDRIEFMPIISKKNSKILLKEESDLKHITEEVTTLFTDVSYTDLKENVTDYEINQVVMNVDSLSSEIFGLEKQELRKLVNIAKQLSKSRNLLGDGSFERLDSWLLGWESISISNHHLFKGKHLLLLPPKAYPSYAYQKIDESRLKANTRYIISGFIPQCKGLEIMVSRYDKDIQNISDVIYQKSLLKRKLNQCKIYHHQYSVCSECKKEPHFFTYTIDVGNVYEHINLGIEIGFRIATPDGFAEIGNVEVREECLLSDLEITVCTCGKRLTTRKKPKSSQRSSYYEIMSIHHIKNVKTPKNLPNLKKVQRKEQKWKRRVNQERMEILAQIQPIIIQINSLYEQGDWDGCICPNITYQHIQGIKLPVLSKQTHWFMADRTGKLYYILQCLRQALTRAWEQIEERNLLKNGYFKNTLTDWTVHGDANIIPLEKGGGLQLCSWDTNISQCIPAVEAREYTVRARGKGKGMIVVQQEETIQQPLIFDGNYFSTKEQTITLKNKEIEILIQSEETEFVIHYIEIF